MRRAFVMAALLIAQSARADDLHYQDYPVGNRAMGLGGAFAAIANDPSGLFYNPAGLLSTTRSSVSVSTSLYGVEKNSADGPSIFDLANFRLSTIPSEIGGTYAVGPIEQGRTAPYAWGFDVLVPSSRDGVVLRRDTLPDGAWRDFQRESTDRTVWIGAGGAFRLRDDLSAGVSAFYLHRTMSLRQRSTSKGPGFHDESMLLDASDGALLARAGLKLTKGDWSYGLALSTPSLAVRSTGQARVTRVDWDEGVGGPGTPSMVERAADSAQAPGSIRLRTQVPAGVRLGAAYTLPKKLTVACDVSAHLPITFERLHLQDVELGRALRLPEVVERRAVVNGACGGEWLFRETMSVALGAFTDFSSAPEIASTADGLLIGEGRGVQPRVHLFGGTFGVGYFGAHSLTRVGVSVASGTGQDATFDPGRERWTVRDVRQTFAFAFVASTFRY